MNQNSKKLSFFSAVLVNFLLAGFAIQFAVEFVLGFIGGFLEASGFDISSTLNGPVRFVFTAIAFYFGVKIIAPYLNKHFVIKNKNSLALYSSLLLLAYNVLSVVIQVIISADAFDPAFAVGLVGGFVSANGVKIVPFYVASRKYIIDNVGNNQNKMETTNSKLPWYLKVFLILFIVYLILNTLLLVLMPAGFSGYETPVWYSLTSAVIILIEIACLFMIFWRKRTGFYSALIVALISIPIDYIAMPSKIVLTTVATLAPLAIVYLCMRPTWGSFK